MFATRFPCDSIAAFGAPAVPLVNINTARSSGCTWASGISVPCTSSSNESGVMTCSTLGTDVADSRDQVGTADGPTMTAFAVTSLISRSSSSAVAIGLSGTATAPIPTVARNATAK